jgi:hypothetical protein
MLLQLLDPTYRDRLASFLQSLGQATVVRGPDRLELRTAPTDSARQEMAIYLRVWKVLHPEADVRIEDDG